MPACRFLRPTVEEAPPYDPHPTDRDHRSSLMARSHGRILTAIWADPDFLALGAGPQRLYLFLLSQPDLAHCGLIALRERRWARAAAGLTAEAVHADLDTLAERGFVVVDTDAEEVLVRSLIRRDDVWRQPNVLAAAIGQIAMVTSTRIRTVLATELRRIRTGCELTDRAAHLIDTALTSLPAEPEPAPSPNSSGNPSRKGSPDPSGNPSAGLIRESAASYGEGERYVSRERVPLPHSPQVPPPAGPAVRPARDTAQAIIGEYVAGCAKRPPGQVLAHLGKVVAGMLAEGIDPGDVRRGMAAWSAKGLHPATLPAVVNEVMNTRASPPAASRPSTTDARVSAALALAAKYAGQEAAAS